MGLIKTKTKIKYIAIALTMCALIYGLTFGAIYLITHKALSIYHGKDNGRDTHKDGNTESKREALKPVVKPVLKPCQVISATDTNKEKCMGTVWRVNEHSVSSGNFFYRGGSDE